MKPIILLLLNSLTFLITLFMNYLGGTGKLTGRSVGDISDLYPTLITPAGYAFSIWGIIYLFLLGYLGYQWFGYFRKDYGTSLLPSGLWFSASNIFNSVWLFLWLEEMLFWSVAVILLLLLSLIQLVIRLKLEVWDAPLPIIIFVWWPICIYTGWIILATTINISVWLESAELLKNTLSPAIWAISVIFIATAIYLWLIRRRNMREAALVGVWGLIAIGVNQWHTAEAVAYMALLAAAILFLASGYHAYLNRKTSPLAKVKF